MQSKSICLLCLCVAACLQPLRAQTVTGSIAGNVLDASGAAVTNAAVSATEQTRNVTVSTKTDTSGRYVFPSLNPGIYTLRIEVPGFKASETRDVNLLANQNLAVPTVNLQVGQVNESIEVSAQGAQLQTESGERSASLVSKQINNIALNSRSYLPLVALVPGITNAPTIQTASHSGIGSINSNGNRSNQNNLTLDGVGNVDTGNNGDQLATVSLDSVQEFRILTSNYQAQYGRSSGSQISVVTRSGTDQFHGSGYIYHRNESLNANNWINNRDGLPRQKFRFNDAGYTLGGPLLIPKLGAKLKNKIYFFTSEEFQNQLQPHGLNRNTVPTLLERRGDFSQSVDKNGNPFPYIKDPQANLPCVATASGDHRGCFQDGGVLGRIPVNRLYQPSLAVLSVYPLPNFTGGTGFNYTSQISASYPRREDLGRVDLLLNEKNKVFARFIYNRDSVTSPYGSFVLGSNIPLVGITDARPGRAWAVNWTSNINPTTVNEFTWGFGKNVINITPTSNILTRTANGLSNLPVLYPSAITNDFIPAFSFEGTRIANANGNFGTNNAPFFNFNTSIEFIDNLSKVIGNHVVKLGGYGQRSRKDQSSFASNNGNYDFSDSPNNPYDTGFGFANAAVGVYNNFNQASQRVSGKYRYTNVEWYVQDTWKVARRLTLDYGLRFYWIQPQYEEQQLASNFLTTLYNPSAAPRLYYPELQNGVKVAYDPANPRDVRPSYAIANLVPNTGNLLNGIVLPGRGISKYLTKNRGISYSPRFGFAYDITGQQKFVIRGGAGIFYDRYQGNEIFNLLTNPPTAFAPSLNFGFAQSINPANALLGPSGLTTLDPSGKNPVTGNYSLGIQSKLPFHLVLDTSYVGSRSWHLISRRNLNAIPYGATFLPQNQDPTNTNTTPGSAALNSNLIRPYPGYGDITLQEFTGTSNFNSLQVSLNRQFASQLFLGLAYTYSKALGVTSDDGGYNRIDNLTRFANYGPLNFDRRHVLAVNYIYNLPPFFRNRNALLHSALDGWQISGLTRYRTGLPYEVGFSVPGFSNPQITGSYTEGARVQVVGNPYANTGGIYNELNPNAFAPATRNNPGALGLGEGRNPFYGPSWNNTDLSIQKEFALGERMAIQLRMDAFNAFNHPNFANGGCNGSGINCTVNFASLNGGVTNAYLNPNGTINNKNGFGTVAGANDPRILQLAARFVF